MTNFVKASDVGAPLTPPTADWLLSFPNAAQNQGYLVRSADGAAAVSSFSLVYDIYLPSAGIGEWVSFFQSDATNGSDGDLFASVDGDGFGIGISSQYHGVASLDAWHRIAFTVEAGPEKSTLSKYIDGVLVGTQQVSTSRYTVDSTSGFLILTDEDGETSAGHLGSFLYTDQVLSADTIRDLGGAKAGGILEAPPSTGHAIQFDFDDGQLAPTFGIATMTPQNLTPVVATPAEIGIAPLPEASDSGVLTVPTTSDGKGGFLVDTGVDGPLKSYSLVFDLHVKAGDLGGYNSLFQTDLTGQNDGDFFMLKNDGASYSVGISSNYDGAATLDAWHRIGMTIEDAGDGTSLMKKYIDGTLVDQQSVDANRYTISSDGFLIFADDDGESALGHLNSFLVSDQVFTEAEMAALGGTDPNGILSEAPAVGNATQFDFDNGNLTATFGPGTMVDKTPVVETPVEEGPKKITAIKDMMVTPEAENTIIDLSTIFAGEGLTYTVQVAEQTVVNPTIVDGKLTLDFGELGFSDIKITATDAEGLSVSDVFRVRVAGENSYTIAAFPDTQNYTSNGALNHIFGDMTQWLVDNKDSHNIQFMVHVGDITDNNLAYQWEVAEAALRKLDGVIPYSLLPGNHDQAANGSAADHSSVYLDELFSPEKQEEVAPDNFGGTYDQETDSARNTYSTFTAPDGTNWLVLSMEFGPRDDVIRWAGDVIEDHLDHRVIVVSHALTDYAGRHDPLGSPLYDEGAGYDYGIGLDPEGANDGETVYRALLAKYPNISMTFSGHIFGDGAETNVSYSQYGTATYEFLVNYQNGVSREITGNGDESLGNRGGNGAIRLVVVDPDNNTVSTETYFTEFDDYLDGYRVKPELDRDGLTGEYRGHQETFTDVDFGTPELFAMAKGGDDLQVDAADGADTATVTLNASRSLNPKGEQLTYSWLNEDGDVIASGNTPILSADLGLGKHLLTLAVTDANGIQTTDEVVVIVGGDQTLLVETFNDGTADGWSGAAVEAPELQFGTAATFGIEGLGDTDTIAFLPALSNGQQFVARPVPGAPSGSTVSSYTLIFDIYVLGANASEYTSLFQLDPTNKSDGELFIQKRSDGTGVLETGGGRHGVFTYDAWQRVAAVVETQADGTTTLTKYINGERVGSQTVSSSRFSFDAADGLMLFTDENGENTDMYVSSVVVSDKVFTDAEIAALGEAKAGGILAEQPTPYTSQYNFNTPTLGTDFGPGTLGFGNGGGTGSFLLKGSVFSRSEAETAEGVAAPEAALWEMSNGTEKMLLWNAGGSQDWSNYVYEASLTSMDNDGIGVAFYYQDADNYYLFKMDGETNRRELIKVQNGVQTVLAEVAAGYQYNVEMSIKVAVVDGAINVFLGDRSVFGGPVLDGNPLTQGTVGLYSSGQHSSIFDNVVVTRADLTAHAGEDARVYDLDGNGTVSVMLDADNSFGVSDIASYVWTDEQGNVVATGRARAVELATGLHKLTLTVTDTAGKTATDRVDIDIVDKSKILVSEGFSTDLSKWTIVDEGEFGGIGANGKASEWLLQDGRLVQTTDLQSRELTWNGATNPDYWQRAWSPLGDGVNVLRVGTYALYNDAAALNWDDYAVEATFLTPDNDGLGFLFHYTDAKNYYKLELDADGVLDSNPSNGAGSIFNLIRMRNGVEEILGQVPGKYEPGLATNLRVEIIDNKIQAYINGEAIFAYPIEDQAHQKGTFALYSWGNQGLTFDDVVVQDLSQQDNGGTAGDDILIGTGGNDVLNGGAGKDAIIGDLGNDVIDGGTGDDTLIGNEGSDQIAGGDGADLIDGGEGNDTLTGGDGSDTYVYTSGSGSDVIIEGAGKAGDQDRLFLDDLTRGDVVIRRQGNDIVIVTGGETVTLKNQLSGGGVEVLSFADGTALVGEQIAAAAVNRGPSVTAPAIATGAEDTRILGQIVASDADGDQLTYAVKTGFGPAHGAILLDAATGKWTYDPAANYNGTDGFTVVVSDGHGGSVEQVVSLQIAPVNDGPVAVDDTGAAMESETKVFNLVANDTDVDGDALALTGFTVESVNGIPLTADAAKAAFAIVDGKLTFTPGTLFADLHEGETATVTLSYTVGDGTTTDTGSFTLTVNGEGKPQNVIIGTETSNILLGTDGDDAITAYGGNDYAFGRDGADVIDGGEGNDYLFGGVGKDVINGGEGNDTLFGDAGDDVLIGDKGNDRMVGGAGSDSFFFRPGFGHDTVMDFDDGDVIDLSTADFANFAEVAEHLSETALGTVLTLDDGSSLTLANVDKDTLTADHFHLVA